MIQNSYCLSATLPLPYIPMATVCLSVRDQRFYTVGDWTQASVQQLHA